MDTKLGSRLPTKDIQNLLLIIRDSVGFKRGNSIDTLFLCKSEVEGEVVGLTSTGCMNNLPIIILIIKKI